MTTLGNTEASATFPATAVDVGADASGAAASAQSAAIAASQPVDSDLTAIAALTTTSYGRAFLALADAAAGRTALGLGTAALSASGDFQPIDSDLTAIAALTTTSYGRALLALADAAAARTALALGTAAVAATGDFDASGAAAAAQAASWPATTAFDATAPTTAAFGDAAAAGSAAKAAHRDHAHGMMALPAIDATAAATDITTRNVSTTAHGLAPKLPNDATKFLDGTGAYTVPPGTGLTNPMTTAADLIVGGASGVPARLAKGADSTVLTVDPTTHLLVWSAPSGGAPTGAAGGGLAGTYPNPTVATNANLTGPVTSVGNATTIADAELAAIAGLTSAADKLPYFTGSGTAALADLSSFIRTLLDDTTAAIARATLGVVNDPWTEIQTTADQTVTNSAVLVDHTGGGGPALTFTAVSGGMYHVNLFLIYSGNDATGDFRFNFTLPTISGWHRWGTGFGASETLTVNTGALANGLTTFGADLIGGADGVGDTPRIVFYEMWFRAGASSAFTLKFANSVASSGRTSTVRTGSVLRYRRLV